MTYICIVKLQKQYIMSYRVPKNLLSRDNGKTKKGEKKNWFTYIMYLAPHKQNSKGVNLCPKASPGCAAACLFNSGAARFNRVQKGKVNKTDYFNADKVGFMAQLKTEIEKIIKRHEKRGEKKIAIRLNGSSDFVFENYKIDGKNIMEMFPEIQFYDYTKDIKRVLKDLPNNYHLTFSKSEENDEEVKEVLANGGNVAVVFEEKPKTFMGYEVIDGDEDDLRFLDKKNVIVGLKYKKATIKGAKDINDEAMQSGFVVTKQRMRVHRRQFLKTRLKAA